ncbi:hypothetical protein ANCCAN_00657 [Ancylostoma caninum]|uniref:SCP domain-containing protein n=1 Tax=Ancylostoma caninum TaxID=29170 RepID=A0A368H975_ANCCA|nr:hypothetical protein ANCCAN_00657 [Ancylostoma caninum]
MEKNEKGEFGMDPMLWWLGEIGRERLFSWYIEWNEPIRYWGHNRNWANLVRHDASRIGCAENYCDRHTKHAIFCLTDKPPLEPNDVVYPWGKGACPEGTCRPPYDGCNIETGLCIKPVPPTTTTTKKPPCQPRLGGLADLFSFNIC